MDADELNTMRFTKLRFMPYSNWMVLATLFS